MKNSLIDFSYNIIIHFCTLFSSYLIKKITNISLIASGLATKADSKVVLFINGT